MKTLHSSKSQHLRARCRRAVAAVAGARFAPGFGRASTLLTTLCLVLFVAACGTVQRPDGGKGLLPEGEAPAAVSGSAQDGRRVELRPPLAGFTLVYFYPKDGTPGCTKEACAFRDVWQEYTKQKVAVIGVSSDDSASHADFAKEEALPFDLVADVDGSWGRAFGVSSFAGLYSRVSFLLTPEGRVARVYPDVDPGLHAREVLKDVQTLQAK